MNLVMLPLQIFWIHLAILNVKCLLSRFQLAYILRIYKFTFALMMSVFLQVSVVMIVLLLINEIDIGDFIIGFV